MSDKKKKLNWVVAAPIALAAFAVFDLFDTPTKQVRVKADAPGKYTDFNKDWGPAVRQSTGVDERFHAMQQIHFGLHGKTETITLMLSDTATVFGVSVAADQNDDLLLNFAIVPSDQCDPTSTFISEGKVEAGGAEFKMVVDCLQTPKGFSQVYQPIDQSQTEALISYLTSTDVAVITYPGYGSVPFDMTGFDAAVEVALKAAPRVVKDSEALAAN